MGKAAITCEDECKCDQSIMDGHGTERNSQLHLHDFYVSQAESCTIVITGV